MAVPGATLPTDMDLASFGIKASPNTKEEAGTEAARPLKLGPVDRRIATTGPSRAPTFRTLVIGGVRTGKSSTNRRQPQSPAKPSPGSAPPAPQPSRRISTSGASPTELRGNRSLSAAPAASGRKTLPAAGALAGFVDPCAERYDAKSDCPFHVFLRKF